MKAKYDPPLIQALTSQPLLCYKLIKEMREGKIEPEYLVYTEIKCGNKNYCNKMCLEMIHEFYDLHKEFYQGLHIDAGTMTLNSKKKYLYKLKAKKKMN